MNLLHNRFFTCFTENGARALADYAEEISYNDQTVLFEEDSPSDCFFLLLEGTVELTKKSDENRSVLIETLHAGDYFGELGILDGSARSARAMSRGVARVARIPGPPFLRILYQEPAHASLHLFERVLRHLRNSNRRVVEEVVREEKIRLIGETASTIIHDLKNFLFVVKLSAEQIMTAHQDSATQEGCRRIAQQTDRIVTVVQDLLDFTRGKPVLNLQVIQISALFDQFQKTNQELLGRPGVKATFQPAPLEVNVDAYRITHVLKNLIENSMDSMGEKGGEIFISAAEAVDSVEICVKDNGPGIAENMRANFFEPLAVRTDKKGSGLAMTVAKKIVEAHGGEIWFETEINKGASFFIRIPKISA